jgi:hypothetical protein
MEKTVIYAERYFQRGIQNKTLYEIEGNKSLVQPLRNCSFDDLVVVLERRTMLANLEYENFNGSSLKVSRSPQGLAFMLKTRLNDDELKSLAKRVSEKKV